MSSREDILKKVKAAQPQATPAEVFSAKPTDSKTSLTRDFINVLESIGGEAVVVGTYSEIASHLENGEGRRVTTIEQMVSNEMLLYQPSSGHELADVEVALIKGEFAVAENGAVWITEKNMGNRALPYICDRLAVVVNVSDIVGTMHEAHDWIGDDDYRFGCFIAGPSKTADIEQSLVLGAHGSKSMTVFLLG